MPLLAPQLAAKSLPGIFLVKQKGRVGFWFCSCGQSKCPWNFD